MFEFSPDVDDGGRPSQDNAPSPPGRPARDAFHEVIDELALSEQRLQDFGALAGDWLWEMDAEGRFTWFSQRFVAFFGGAVAQHIGRNRLQLVGADPADPVWRRHVADLAARRAFRDLEYPVFTARGERRLFRESGQPFFDAYGRFRGYRGVGTDITNERAALEEAARAQSLLAASIEVLSVGYAVYDADDRLVAWNRRFCEIYELVDIRAGMTFAEIVRQVANSGLLPDALPGDDAFLNSRVAIRRARQLRENWEGRFANGRWVLVNETRTPDGGIAGLYADITQRKEAQSTIQRLGEMVEDLPIEVYIIDPASLTLVQCNKRALENLRYAAADMEALRVVDIVEDRDRGRLRALVRGIGDAAASHELTFVRRDGSTYPVEMRLSRSALGSTPMVAAFVTDISQRRLIEDQLHHAQKLEAVGRLAGGIAHEFNNLLTAIGGFARLIRRHDEATDTLRKWSADIIEAADNATELTSQLLSFGRKQMLSEEIVTAGDIVARIDRLVRPLIGERIELETRIEHADACANVDPDHLVQSLLNLAINGRDAMPEGGRLIVTSRISTPDADLRARHEAAMPQPYLAFAVTDTGSGIAPEHLDKIFEPFFTTKELGKGTGLGLSMVYGMASQSGGFVDVESAQGLGSTFTVYLPLVSEAAMAGTSRAPCVLVVDDKPAILEIVRLALQEDGFRVLVAENAAAARRVFVEENGAIDLLLSDVAMPGTRGPALAQALLDQKPDLKVLFMSGYAVRNAHGGADRHAEIPQGFKLIPKPFKPAELSGLVSEMIEARA